jgi:hypothetical protein
MADFAYQSCCRLQALPENVVFGGLFVQGQTRYSKTWCIANVNNIQHATLCKKHLSMNTAGVTIRIASAIVPITDNAESCPSFQASSAGWGREVEVVLFRLG